MKEVKEILERVSRFEPGEQATLATVVDVRGSGYRLPGARMLMLANGDTFGMVSGGCLEADVLERAKKVLKSGSPEVFTYDTTDDENSVFSLNMGCRGVIRVLLESVDADTGIIGVLRSVRDDRKKRTVATVIASETGASELIGRRLSFDGAEYFGDVGSDPETLGLREAVASFHRDYKRYEFESVESADGRLEFAIESMLPPIRILLFGAGADAVPLANLASDLGWQTSVYDHRTAFLTPDRFGAANELILHNDEKPLGRIDGDARTVAVVMTHNYQHDRRILPNLLRSNLAYIAALGPKRRTEQLLEELSTDGEKFTNDQLSRLYAPAGLDIGGDSPESIALSIAAEIQTVLRDRDGGHLRDREGSIYDR